MSKIASLKRWLPLPQAAHLIATFTEDSDVTEADLLQLALENTIQLSAILPSIQIARKYNKISLAEVEYAKYPSLAGGENVSIPKNGAITFPHYGFSLIPTNLEYTSNTCGPFELAMIGGERDDIEHRLMQLNGLKLEPTINLCGTFLCTKICEKETYLQLHDFNINDHNNPNKTYPLGQLPENTLIVIKQEELRRFIESIAPQEKTLITKEQTPTPTSTWPWGSYHTTLLDHLEAAAKKFWANYDPTDKTTAPINKRVSDWLIEEKEVSKNIAEANATILRPDGLPTGPRTCD